MKQLILLALGLGLVVGVGPSIAQAEKEKKAEGQEAGCPAKGCPLAKYDLNKDNQLDDTELATVKKDYAEKKIPGGKRFDTNKDGQFDDAELAAIKEMCQTRCQAKKGDGDDKDGKAKGKGKKEGKGKKHGKKGQ